MSSSAPEEMKELLDLRGIEEAEPDRPLEGHTFYTMDGMDAVLYVFHSEGKPNDYDLNYAIYVAADSSKGGF